MGNTMSTEAKMSVKQKLSHVWIRLQCKRNMTLISLHYLLILLITDEREDGIKFNLSLLASGGPK